MSKTIQEEIEELKAENAFYKQNGAVGLFYELNRVVNDTVKVSKATTINSLLTGTEEEKGEKRFEKMQVLLKNAKEHVIWMDEMKGRFGITGDETKDKGKVSFLDKIAQERK